ncbi:hypothetical protein OIDMADRAFT_166920 [Oidiodendron maius Zn]|uniref:Ig-like domain-containing protein n=1 Tax=Oidiodendron maius (strain Zn) TaxID=913774 RepID=A0A0C3DBI8_OIDMZ|nr:hypothetical protein OIDMADRAFT_166920 [Oidiodendron maius Zn]
MRSFVTISVLEVFVTTVLAVPSVQKLQDGQEVKLTIQQIKLTSESDIAVTDPKTSQLLGHACSTTLNSGAFADLPISADLDHMGAGKITLGSKTYQVHEDPEISGGVTCSRVYSDAQTYTACTVILPESLDLAPVSKTDGCFAKGASPVFENTIDLITTAQSTPLHPLENVTIANRGLEERQGACGIWSSYTATVGNGNPHQNYYNTQLSENINCNCAVCSVGDEESESITVGWSASATVDEWIDGGFDVQVSWTTGKQYTCQANPGDTVCIWYLTAHTAYTVQNYNYNQCTGAQPSGTAIIFSPNKNNAGGYYYCVINSCANEGYHYWDYSGPAGGPP